VELPQSFFQPRDGPATTRDEYTTETYFPRSVTPEVKKLIRHGGLGDEVISSVPPGELLQFVTFTRCEYQVPKDQGRQNLANGCVWFEVEEVCSLRTEVYWVQGDTRQLLDVYSAPLSRNVLWVLACPDGSITKEGAGTPQHAKIPTEIEGSKYAYTAPSGNVEGKEYSWRLKPPVVFQDECIAVATYVLYVRDVVVTGPVATTVYSAWVSLIPEQAAMATFNVCTAPAGEVTAPQAPLAGEDR